MNDDMKVLANEVDKVVWEKVKKIFKANYVYVVIILIVAVVMFLVHSKKEDDSEFLLDLIEGDFEESSNTELLDCRYVGENVMLVVEVTNKGDKPELVSDIIGEYELLYSPIIKKNQVQSTYHDDKRIFFPLKLKTVDNSLLFTFYGEARHSTLSPLMKSKFAFEVYIPKAYFDLTDEEGDKKGKLVLTRVMEEVKE